MVSSATASKSSKSGFQAPSLKAHHARRGLRTNSLRFAETFAARYSSLVCVSRSASSTRWRSPCARRAALSAALAAETVLRRSWRCAFCPLITRSFPKLLQRAAEPLAGPASSTFVLYPPFALVMRRPGADPRSRARVPVLLGSPFLGIISSRPTARVLPSHRHRQAGAYTWRAKVPRPPDRAPDLVVGLRAVVPAAEDASHPDRSARRTVRAVRRQPAGSGTALIAVRPPQQAALPRATLALCQESGLSLRPTNVRAGRDRRRFFRRP